MTVAKITVAAIAAVAIGFIFGLTVGRGTREALPGATQTSFEGGVLQVRVDARRALTSGLAGILG